MHAKAAGSAAPTALDDPDAEALRQFLYDPASPTTVPDLPIVNNELFFPTSACEELWKLQGEVDRWIINTPAHPGMRWPCSIASRRQILESSSEAIRRGPLRKFRGNFSASWRARSRSHFSTGAAGSSWPRRSCAPIIR